MLSDDSSSDSETGRFKGSSQKKEVDNSNRHKSDNKTKRRSDESRREISRRDDRKKIGSFSPVRQRTSRYSPPRRRRFSRDRSSSNRYRRSPERHSSSVHDKRYNRSVSRDRTTSQRQSKLSPALKKDTEESNKTVTKLPIETAKDKKGKSPGRQIVKDVKTKSSEIHKVSSPIIKTKSISPIDIKDTLKNYESDGEPVASYYNCIPVEDVSKESSVTDSSDDERLRAKLLKLALDKGTKKTKKKKTKKKHKKRSSRSKEKDESIEVTSTTDIQEEQKKIENNEIAIKPPEVSSSKPVDVRKEAIEEGEITSGDEEHLHKDTLDIDPNDLRFKIKQTPKKDSNDSPDLREKLKHKIDICGPALPPHLEKRFKGSDSSGIEGPALPPYLQDKGRHIGPSVTSNMRKVLAEAEPVIVAHESSEEDDGIGPLPAGSENKWTDAHERLEERAIDIKLRSLDGCAIQNTDKKVREEWMLALPDGKTKYLGLEARSFRAKEGPDMSDRSSWTDTPEQKELKAAGLPSVQEDSRKTLQEEAQAKFIADRDTQQELAIRKHKKKHKRDESLLDMHQTKLKKKKKKEEKDDGKNERRPFTRDIDLQVNKFDEAQKKSMIKKAQHLDTRFSRGEAKYL